MKAIACEKNRKNSLNEPQCVGRRSRSRTSWRPRSGCSGNSRLSSCCASSRPRGTPSKNRICTVHNTKFTYRVIELLLQYGIVHQPICTSFVPLNTSCGCNPHSFGLATCSSDTASSWSPATGNSLPTQTRKRYCELYIMSSKEKHENRS